MNTLYYKNNVLATKSLIIPLFVYKVVRDFWHVVFWMYDLSYYPSFAEVVEVAEMLELADRLIFASYIFRTL